MLQEVVQIRGRRFLTVQIDAVGSKLLGYAAWFLRDKSCLYFLPLRDNTH